MKLYYAKMWLKKYIKYNHNHLDENKLNRAIINLSHRVYKSHGVKGHNVRQKIRMQLVEYSRIELAKYGTSFDHPLRISYKQRHRIRVFPSRRMNRGVISFIFFILKVLGLIILAYILWYILTYHL